ncbi:hypothetical protein ASG49_12315 [Marmoricola sp. Leaf446]|uniref:ferritin-like domain-containing protein n=1 Tax=Marmoricola sp. Leaf446 TaxID=1736379 RepID=UPI0006FDFDC7|nr:ferritin-like domain-containing protein [Marmoricola sp. Leaf446]KQT91110.1 hypothetical protein ASG49_12315 [Marmoricola sp. Leaf446]
MTPVEALQNALAAEHASVYLYGLLGARASASAQPVLFDRLQQAYADHRTARDDLVARLARRDVDPVASETDYAPPGPVSTPAQIEAVARTLERRVALTYGETVAHTSGEDRLAAIDALDAAAVRGLGFGEPPTAFPGLA